jgi:anti-sigma regulatory factor (Ser/Thr protein kinase)
MRRAHSFSREPGSVAAARRFATEALADVDLERLSSVELMVSELATNCIRHADSAFELNVIQEPGTIRIEVNDSGGGEPVLLSPTPDDPNGRGLHIVDMLSDEWGVERSAEPGKTVWFGVIVRPAPAADEDPREPLSRTRVSD